MALDTLEVELTLEDGKFVARMKNAGDLADRFADRINRIDRNVARTERRIRGFTSSLRDWVVIVGQARNALNQIAFLTTDWAMRIVRVNAEIERITFLLEGMSQKSTAAERAKEAQGTLNELFDLAKTAPFSINAITDSMVKFKSVGLDPMDGSMQSLIDAVAAFGGTDETMKRASIAIQQMAGKGVISMEELRQQLGEAVPQAITIMARELGVSYGKLVEEISLGNVEAKGALEAMFRGFEVDFGNRAKKMMRGYNGQIARARTLLTETFTQNDGMSGFFDEVTDGLRRFNDRLESGQLESFVTTVGEGLREITSWTWNMVSGIIEATTTLQAFYGLLQDPPGHLSTELRTILELLNKISNIMGGVTGGIQSKLYDWLGISNEKGKIIGEGGFLPWFAELVHGEEKAREVIDRINGLPNELEEANFGQRLEEGLSIQPEDLPKAESAFAAQVVHVEELKQQIHGLEDDLRNLKNTGFDRLSTYSTPLYMELIAQIDAKSAELKEAERQMEVLSKEPAWDTSSFKNRGKTEELNADRKRTGQEVEALRRELNELQRQAAKAIRDAEGHAVNQIYAQIDDKLDELEKAQDALAREGERLAKMDVNLDGAVGAAGQEMFGDWYDETGLDEQLAEIKRLRSEAFSDIAADESLTAAQANEARYEAEIRMVEAMIEANTEAAAISAEAFLDMGEAGIAASAIAAAHFAANLAELRAKIDALRNGEGITDFKSTLLNNGGGGGGSKGKAEARKRETAMKRFEEEAKRIARESRDAFEKITDPFAYIMPDDIEKTREKLLELAETVPALKGRIGELMATVKETFSNNVLIDLREQLRDLDYDNMSPGEQRRTELKEFEAGLESMKQKLTEQGLWRVEHEQAILDMIDAKRDSLNSESAWGQYLSRWKSASEQIGEWMSDTFEGIGDQLADLIMTSKDDMDDWEDRFRDFSRQVLQTFLSMSINNGMSALMSGASNVNWGQIGGMIAGGINAGTNPDPAGTAPIDGSIYHAGGIAGMGGRGRAVPADLFATAPRYHTGGIAGNEVPAILERGEGVFTRDQMKALGGRSGGDVQVNMINNSGQEIEAEPQNRRFDGEKMILDVVMRAANKPGSFRDALKGAK